MFWGRQESVERLTLIFCTFFADRRITEQFMQLFKKDFEKLFTENETRANIAQTHDWVQKLYDWRIFYAIKHYN